MNLVLSIGTLRGGVPIQFIWPVTQSKEIRDKNLFKVKKITVYSKIAHIFVNSSSQNLTQSRRDFRLSGRPRLCEDARTRRRDADERANPFADDRSWELSTARLADRPRKPPQAGADAGTCSRDVADSRALARAGAGRRHDRRDPRDGARRRRHYLGRRDQAGELLEPLRHRAWRRRP